MIGKTFRKAGKAKPYSTMRNSSNYGKTLILVLLRLRMLKIGWLG